MLKGGRRAVFMPLLVQRPLSREEADAILGVSGFKGTAIERAQLFLGRVEIQFTILQELPNGNIAMRLHDPQIHRPYCVLVDTTGRVQRVDFCCSGYQEMYLSELTMFVRESGSIHHIGGFGYE
jgi:hypothetical protein